MGLGHVAPDGDGPRPARLRVIGESAAGHPFDAPMGDGEAVRIFTGATLPPGADTISIQEDVDRAGDAISVREPPARNGEFVRPAGLDFAEGQVLLPAGRLMTARDVGLAAAMNHAWVMVRRRPRVAFLATGDEVVMPGGALAPGQIVSSNSLAMTAFVNALGGTAISLGIAPDDADSLGQMLAGAKGADLLITMGGASVGDHDLVQQVLNKDGFDLSFYRIAMRPGKPLIFGHVGSTAMLGLPGNPVSSGVTSALFLRAALNRMLGRDDAETTCDAILGRDLPANGKREDYMRATLAVGPGGQLTATPFERQDSSMLATFAAADCLVIRPVAAPPARAGETVRILRLGFAAETF